MRLRLWLRLLGIVILFGLGPNWAQGFQIGFSQDLTVGANSKVEIQDSTKIYKWRPEAGRLLVTRIWAEGWRSRGGPWRWSLQQQETQHSGLVGRYRCLIMCGWVSNRTLGSSTLADSFNYRLDTISLARPDLVSITLGNWHAGIEARLALNRFKGKYSGSSEYLHSDTWPTLGTDITVTWAIDEKHQLQWTQGVEGLRSGRLSMDVGSRRMALFRELSPGWRMALGWNHSRKRLVYEVNGDSLRLDERSRAWSVSVIHNW